MKLQRTHGTIHLCYGRCKSACGVRWPAVTAGQQGRDVLHVVDFLILLPPPPPPASSLPGVAANRARFTAFAASAVRSTARLDGEVQGSPSPAQLARSPHRYITLQRGRAAVLHPSGAAAS